MGYYYYGARYYDPAVSIFLSVDPLAEKYPGINPYTYVANNPINAIDPDGRDFRMITQRNKNGKIVNVSLHATIYLQGAGASKNLANTLNKAFANNYNTTRNIEGANVSLNVTYIYDGEKLKNGVNLASGENILNVRTDMPVGKSSFINSTYNEATSSYNTGNTGEINSKSSNVVKTTIHESMHFLGLSDRYDDFTGDNINLGSSKQPNTGFRDDIMGGGNGIGDVHFENILNYSKAESNSSNNNGFNYSGNLKKMYDRASHSGLLNGSKPSSNYHERSNQVK